MFIQRVCSKLIILSLCIFLFMNLSYKDMLPTGSFDITVEFLQKVTDMMFAYINKSVDRKEKVNLK